MQNGQSVFLASLPSHALCFQPRSRTFVGLLARNWIRKNTDCFAVDAEVALPQKKNQAKKEGGQKEQQHLQMGLCVSGERADFEGVVRYNGQTFLGVRHGEGTYLYKNGDMYTGQWKWNHKHGHRSFDA